ncbi:MAG: S1C family serine protease [Acidimicrobiales bacterium]
MGEGRYDDDPDDSGELVPAPDRLWRHPAELGAEQAAANLAARRALGRRWPSMTVSFIAGATLVALAWIFTGNEPSPDTSASVEVVDVPTVPVIEGPPGFDEWANAIAENHRGSVVALHMEGDMEWPRANAILYDTGGFLLTSAHAIDGANIIFAKLSTGLEVPAEVIASDEVSGVAVLKVPSPELDPPTFSPGNVAPLDRLVGLAAHTDDEGALVRGVQILGEEHVASLPNGDLLSGLYRLSDELDDTWAGAPIIDENGGIVAMAVRARSGANYAIPTTLAREVAYDLIDTGRTETVGWLGVSLDPQTISEDLREERDVPGGVLVRRVWDQTPAARGGLVAGDVIIGLGSVNVLELGDLQTALRALPPGEAVELRYSRRVVPNDPILDVNDPTFTGERHSTTIVLGAQPYV